MVSEQLERAQKRPSICIQLVAGEYEGEEGEIAPSHALESAQSAPMGSYGQREPLHTM